MVPAWLVAKCDRPVAASALDEVVLQSVARWLFLLFSFLDYIFCGMS